MKRKFIYYSRNIPSVLSVNMYLKTNGQAWGWGYNLNGQIGDNTTVNKLTPVAVCGAHTFCQIAGGQFHSLTIDKNGKAWGWGINYNGQLGDNTVTNRCTPVAVYGAHTFCQIASGQGHALSIDYNGKAWGWGYNGFGKLGDNSTVNQSTPVAVCGAHTFCKIAGSYHSLAIDYNGKAWGWGYNYRGQIGDNTIDAKSTPVAVLGATKTFCKIAASSLYTLAIDYNGQAWGWGYNVYGQLGDNSVDAKSTPVAVLGTTKTFCQISGGYFHSLALDYNGKAWGWGYNGHGELGDNSTVSQSTPVAVCGAHTFCQIIGGQFHSLAIDNNGRIWAWGSDNLSDGGLGIGIGNNHPRDYYNKIFYQICYTNDYILSIDKNGQAWSWGYNQYGILGDNTIVSKTTPVAVCGAHTFCKISAGQLHSLAIDNNGKAWSWGYNNRGQLGDNSVTSRMTPVAVLGTTKTFCQIAGGTSHSLAIDYNGKAWAWGYNLNGQLGDNSVTSRRIPVAVLGTTKTFCQIAGGQNNSAAIDKNGKAWSWGFNSYGQLGDNSLTSRRTPVAVCGAHTFCQISGGYNYHSLVIDNNGQAWGWGYNNLGRLGDNSITSRLTPVAVCGGHTFCKIAAGVTHSLAIDKNGKAWGWGDNQYSQSGGDNQSSQLTPVAVYGNHTFCKIFAGRYYSVALDKNNQAWGWGVNSTYVSIGNYKKTPVAVCI